ncbi:MAG: phosphoenolpyruvate--protein phosphotransferase, partial [Proteobacteria bacterium]|nr:phosphoenolpyruvate--protein phosphotransferase [Pseudomonadota bacterium]
INAEWALKKSVDRARAMFSRIRDDYIRSRIKDIEDVTDRITRNLVGSKSEDLGAIRERVIIVSRDLSPADTTQMRLDRVMGFITDMGSRTSHTAIMAQALEIPAVVGLEDSTSRIKTGDLIIVDGTAGHVIINPDEKTLEFYYGRQRSYESYQAEIVRTAHLPAETLDHRRIVVKGNIEWFEEVAAVIDHGGEGIGLYRTEFLYLSKRRLPTEEELFEDYRDVTQILSPRPVTIRTLDLGGDKFASSLDMGGDINPALGLRAIRLCLREQDIFRNQLRAILRASAFGHIKIMFPMISGLQEFLMARDILDQVRRDLDRDGIEYDPEIQIGTMIEVPSAVVIADILAAEADFFSLGTNDLIQYSLAIDRVNEHVAHMYEPLHPAVLRMIQAVAQAGHTAGIKVSVCGEMAGDPICVPILLGMGLDELSMTSLAIPRIKRLIRMANMAECQEYLNTVLRCRTTVEVRQFVDEVILKRFSDLLDPLEAMN